MLSFFRLISLFSLATAAVVPRNFGVFEARLLGSNSFESKVIDSKNVKGPGFISIFPSVSLEQSFDMFISSFGMFSKDSLLHVQDIGTKHNSFSALVANETQFTGRHPLNWPNQLSQTPLELFGQQGVLVSGGFLPPGKNNGGIWFVPYKKDGSLDNAFNLVFTKGWFYHQALVFDVNGDGQLDILSCRARKPAMPFAPTGGKLVWLEPKDRKNPGLNGPGWLERELADGCDVYLELIDLDGDGRMEIIGTDFFTKREITLFWTENSNGDYTKDINQRSIDNTIGSPFDIRLVDLNGDGKPEILATNHAKKRESPSGSVYAYEMPENWKDDQWKRHTLISDIPTRQSGHFEASPGTAQPFFPSKDSFLTKPYIMVAGDGSQEAFYLVPKSDSNQNNWEYESKLLHDCKSVVGGIAIKDVDNDGFVEVFVPCYYTGKVNVFTFAQK